MIRTSIGFATALLLCLMIASPAAPASQHSAFVLLDASGFSDVRHAVSSIEASGGHVRHIFPNVALIAEGVDESLRTHCAVKQVYFGEFAPEDVLESYGREAWLAARAWLGSQEPAREGPTRSARAVPIPNDVLERTPSRGVSDTYYATSEYMAGTIVVGLILPECMGESCTEAPWTTQQVSEVFSEVVGAMDWWVDRAAGVELP